jgi:flagellar hook-basal body complex protein FliE
MRRVPLVLTACVLLAGACGTTPAATISPSGARAAFECSAVQALQAADAKVPQLQAALRGGDQRHVVLAANAVLLAVLPSASARSTDSDPADTLDPLVGTALWDLVETAGNLESSSTAAPPASHGPLTVDAAMAALAQARQAVQAAVRERDRLVSAGALRCP